MRDLALLLRAIAWPTIALLVLLLFRRELRSVIVEFSEKLKRSSRLKLKMLGLELAEEVARGTVKGQISNEAVKEPEKEFERLAVEYDKLDIADRVERAEARFKLADQLGQLALKLRLPRAAMAQSISEGKLVALATAAALRPMASDLAALETAAQAANFNFTRYRIALALIPILARPVVGRETLTRVESILTNVEDRPNATTDEALQRLIDRTRATVAELDSLLS